MKTILVIEDQAQVRENITEMLALARYDVVQAVDGKRGIELARSTKPDLILCDIMMPELDGYGVLHILRKDPITASIPIIFLTAKAETTDFRTGMNLGAADYLTKPFDDITLLNTVELRLDQGSSIRRQANSDGLTTLLSAVEGANTAYPIVHFPKKQFLYAEGNQPTALYYVRRGQFKHFKTDAMGNQLITRLSGAGNFVGLSIALPGMPLGETVEALTDTEVCAIPKADFLALLTNDTDVAGHVIRTLLAEIAEYNDRLLKLAYQSVRQRVAEALLLVYHKFYAPTAHVSGDRATKPADQKASPPMALSRENWSNLVGSSTETIIRVLSDLRTEGLIELTGSQVTILDLDRLARMKH
ncbi:response regulator [Fibrella sp. WM1]|uniref:response regulator n=1 Tax=Fibrella musci TaxID=3242485 RepID=UPI0035225948